LSNIPACGEISGVTGGSREGSASLDGDLDLANAAVRNAYLFGDLLGCKTVTHATIDGAEAPLRVKMGARHHYSFAAEICDQAKKCDLAKDALQDVAGTVMLRDIRCPHAIEKRGKRQGWSKTNGLHQAA